MRRETTLKYEFVEYIPDRLINGTIYISVAFATAAHKCCCGCGNEVITPLSPTDWTLIFDGQSISLNPSIGNWNFACQSHYWIIHNRIKWAPRWSQKDINSGRAHDSLTKGRYFDNIGISTEHDTISSIGGSGKSKPKESLWRRLKKWLFW